MISQNKKRFEVDDEGFKTQMSEMPMWRLAQEIVSNSFDEESVTQVGMKIVSLKENEIIVMAHDNGNGFRNVEEIYTLYKDSYKRTNSNQRGRYNLGDKQFFAVAVHGSVKTNDNIVTFDEDGRTVGKLDDPVMGVLIQGTFNSSESVDDIVNELRKVAVPEGIQYTLNDEVIKPREIVHKFNTVLRTPKATGANEKLVDIKQVCEVILYSKDYDEDPMLMELGVPVNTFKQNLNWHIDVRQKVPIPTSRDMVSDAYLQDLYAKVLDNTIDLIGEKEIGENWIKDALKRAEPESAIEVLKKTYGTDKVMIESSTDHRANEKAMEAGVILVKSGTFDSAVMKNLAKDNSIIKYAGKEFETTFGDWESVEPNQEMLEFAEKVKRIAKYVTKKDINVHFFKMPNGADVANYGGDTMSFNISYCGGMKGFKKINEFLLGVIIHELSHAIDPNNPECSQYSHLKMDFIRSMEKVSAKIAMKGIDYFD